MSLSLGPTKAEQSVLPVGVGGFCGSLAFMWRSRHQMQIAPLRLYGTAAFYGLVFAGVSGAMKYHRAALSEPEFE